MGKNILITGGTGLIGQTLKLFLEDHGHHVAVLTRYPERSEGKAFHWDPGKQVMDPAAIAFADVLIHLAGENVSARRWTKKQKKNILDSRILSTRLLHQEIQNANKKPGLFIGASAVGYYGAVTGEHIFAETDPPGHDFLARTTVAWEEATGTIARQGIRTVILRLGVVFSSRGGALQKMIQPVRWGLGAPLGHSRQVVPWIAVEDVAGMVSFSMQNNALSGVFNAVAPQALTNREVMKQLAAHLGKPFFLPPVPAFLLRLIFGEMASILLEGSAISADKLMQSGYRFRFSSLEEWLSEKL